MAFSRIRKGLAGGDFDRSANQQRTLRGIHARIRSQASSPGFIERGVMTVMEHMATNAQRAATLVRALEASVTGDSTLVGDLYTDGVRGWAPAMSVASAAELAVELEDREEAFSDIELAVSPLR